MHNAGGRKLSSGICSTGDKATDDFDYDLNNHVSLSSTHNALCS